MRRSDYLSQDSEPVVVEEVQDHNPKNTTGRTSNGDIVNGGFVRGDVMALYPSRADVESERNTMQEAFARATFDNMQVWRMEQDRVERERRNSERMNMMRSLSSEESRIQNSRTRNITTHLGEYF